MSTEINTVCVFTDDRATICPEDIREKDLGHNDRLNCFERKLDAVLTDQEVAR